MHPGGYQSVSPTPKGEGAQEAFFLAYIMKICSRCNTNKALENFSVDRQKNDGLRPECKNCSHQKIVCVVPGCGNFVSSGGMCSLHYQRNFKYGDPNFIWKPKVRNISERLFAKLKSTNHGDCWIWNGATADGYGIISVRPGRNVLVHRLSYMLHIGPIPQVIQGSKTFICHTCDTRLCVNPSHLFLGNNAINMTDMKNKGRARNGHTSKGKK